MDIAGKHALVLGGHGLVGMAVCRALLPHRPALLVVASRETANAEEAVAALRREVSGSTTRIVPASGDVFLRAEWAGGGRQARAAVLADADRRRALIADTLEPLDEAMVRNSLLVRLISGEVPGEAGAPADIVVDCINTATAVSYQNLYRLAHDLLADDPAAAASSGRQHALETLLASLYVPQLVRHLQLLFEAMRRAGTEAYVKVGTTGTGGMGLNIPYTHGEEKPSRLLLAKAALAGAQTMLTLLMARTPDGPRLVKEIKPGALIGWKEIAYGPVRARGRDIPLYDCRPEQAVAIADPAVLASDGAFGTATGGTLQGVYIDTGENGLFSAGEFAAITALGQMELVTPEEIAANVVAEILGAATGRDVIAALDGAVMAPTYRGGYLRDAALSRLRRLERDHGEAVAFEILGPPRLSKLLFEAHLLARIYGTMAAAAEPPPAELAAALAAEIVADADLRQRAVSVGIPILLADGARLLRGPVLKAATADQGWIDLTPANMTRWQQRFRALRARLDAENKDTSSRPDRLIGSSRIATPEDDSIDIGETVAWIFETEDGGARLRGPPARG